MGDKVHCPIHGDTIITEGFQTVSFQPSQLLAYEGCKTSCGAELIGGKQLICFIDFDNLPTPSVSLPVTHPAQVVDAVQHYESSRIRTRIINLLLKSVRREKDILMSP